MSRALAVLVAVAALPLYAAAENPADAADPGVGQTRFHMFCASCHGATGDGKGVAAGGLNPAPRDFTAGAFKYGGSDQDIFDVISNGAASRGGSPLMVAWSPVISEPDRWALVRYIRSLEK